MHRTFHCFDQILNLFIACSEARIEREWRDLEALLWLWLAASLKSLPEQSIHCSFKGVACTTHFLVDLPGHVIVDGQGRSHIMMFPLKAS
jgi:hypothetical protein